MTQVALTSTAVIAGAAGCATSRTATSNIATPTTSAYGPATTPPGYGPPSVLPVTGLNDPQGLALDAAGTVYVSDQDTRRVMELPAG